jgi:hypothetical protein
MVFTKEQRRKQGERFRQMNLQNRGKSLSERFGEEKAKEIKEKMSKTKIKRLKEDKKFYETRKKQLKKITDKRKGKSFEEIFGEEKAKRMKIQFREKKLGENSFNWKGGTSQNYYRNLIKYSNMVQKCAIDGSIKHLLIHHIDKNNKHNELSNLIILCSKCHRNLHLGYINLENVELPPR